MFKHMRALKTEAHSAHGETYVIVAYQELERGFPGVRISQQYADR